MKGSVNITRARNALWSAAALVIVVSGMREAQEVLLPIVMAAMLAIIASPAVSWLERRRIPSVVGVLMVVSGIMGGLAMITILVGGSVASFKSSVPLYQRRLAEMTYGLFQWLDAHGGPKDAGKLLEVIEPGAAAGKAMAFVGSSMNALAGALSNTILVVLTMVLILLEGATVPRKLRALAGDPEADISQFQRIASEVQAYLFIKTILSVVTGFVVAVWAGVLGVDFALLWGLVAFLLNYIPNIGSIVAAVPAMLLALVQHGVGTSLALGAGYVVVNMVVGNVVEPMWMGRKLGLSTTVVFLSLVVWGWVWGPVGMLLSVPLTMVIKIMLENSKDWSFIATLLDSGLQTGRDIEDRVPLSISPSTLRVSLVPGMGNSRDAPATPPPTSEPASSEEAADADEPAPLTPRTPQGLLSKPPASDDRPKPED